MSRTSLPRATVVIAALLGAITALASACSLSNQKHDPCKDDAQCATVFGAGSKCVAGYCTDPMGVECQQTGKDGRACYGCPPKTTPEFHNACTDAQCAPFDEKRLTKLTPDGGLPPLP